MMDFDSAVPLLRAQGQGLIAIDGLPVSGKSTLAERLKTELGASVVYLDDFVRPSSEWRGQAKVDFPFTYIRYDGFMQAVVDLAAGRPTSYRGYDWSTDGQADSVTTVYPTGLVVIEGVSALHPDLAALYDLRLWVESDGPSTLDAALKRGVGDWEREWRELFMPSVALYLATQPRQRSDHIVGGRGACI